VNSGWLWCWKRCDFWFGSCGRRHGFLDCCRRRRSGFGALHEARWRQRRRHRLRWFGLSGRLPPLDHSGWRIRERGVRRHSDISLTGHAVDELPRHDFFDGAGRALHLDAVIALEQSDHFLARRVEQFRDFVDPNSGHSVCKFEY
jgi:hypothetical protein